MKTTEPTYLAIPFDQLEKAKKQAGKLENGQNAIAFDSESKMWFAKPGADLEKLANWRVDSTLIQKKESNPQEEFGDFIYTLGGVLDGAPIMDGSVQRISMKDDKPGEKSGSYVGHEDGFPNGWLVDHRKGDYQYKWSMASDKLDPITLLHIKAATAQERLRRKNELRIAQDAKSKEVTILYNNLPQAGHNHPYLLRKGVMAAKGVHIDPKNNLVIPLSNSDDAIRTLQTISPNGTKLLTKGGEKVGNFYVIGGTLKKWRAYRLCRRLCYRSKYRNGHSTSSSYDRGCQQFSESCSSLA
ncbi:hypothetical protein C6H68_14315 [Photorhabdus luminescens]|nr:hypothetical protein C6H68_14315 [Photorhabdus luminescens]